MPHSMESVISSSPGLEDDEDPELTPEEKACAISAFENMKDEEDRVTDLKALLFSLNIKLDTIENQAVSLDDFLRLYTKLYAPVSRYGTRFRTAAGRGDIEKLKELSARGCDPTRRDGLGLNALHMAASAGKLCTVDYLARLEPALGKTTDNQGFTPLLHAAAAGHAAVVDKLLALGSDLQALTIHGRNALHWACAKGRFDVYSLLIKRGGLDLKQQDNAGMTPLHLAAQHGHLTIVTKLIARNHQLASLKNSIGITPRDYQDDVFWTRAEPPSARKRSTT